jgi:hypothetical protein
MKQCAVFTNKQLKTMIAMQEQLAIKMAGELQPPGRVGICDSVHDLFGDRNPYSEQLEALFDFLVLNKAIPPQFIFIQPKNKTVPYYGAAKTYDQYTTNRDKRIDFHVFRVYCLELYRATLYG